MRTFFKFLIFILIILVGFAGIAIYWTFYKPLPNYKSTESLSGLHQSVNIHWDSYGVPHIYAKDQDDLYFALGYVHAQDRLWQMTLFQMAGQGRFSEFLGEDLLPVDKHQRIIGFWDTAKKIQAAMPDSTLRVLKAYTRGVNAYVNNNRNKLPIQFALVDMDPIPWTVTHTIAISRLLAWQLNVSWLSEIDYAYLQKKLPADKFNQLLLNNTDQPPAQVASKQANKLESSLVPMMNQELKIRKLLNEQGTHVGSNAWVVDGSKTETGFPLLAGDPHLGLNAPGKWYEVHLHLNGKNVSGATVPGLPAVILGQNDFLAWSLTNLMEDDTDFFLEQQNPNDRGQYIADTSNVDSTAVYEPFKIKREVIKIKGGAEKVMEKRSTKHGPVISDIYPTSSMTDGKIITMQWTGNQVSDEFDAFYKINWANSFNDFQQALSEFKVPGQNFMYADKTGNIAMFSVGKVPIRNHNPILFRKGWDPDYDWKGYIPFQEMPRIINPEQGWIANANNKVTPDNYPYYIGTFWEPESRIKRIRQYLTQNDTFSPDIFKIMQNDSYSYQARVINNAILPVLKNADPKYNFETVISYLDNWNYKYEPSASAASIMDVFYMKLARNTLQDEMGKTAYSDFIKLESMPVRTMDRFILNGSSFFDDVRTDSVETERGMILKSMAETSSFLADSLGQEPFEWHWENLHTITFKPPLFGQAADKPDAGMPLKLIVNNLLSLGPFPAPGHGMSVNNGEYSWNDPFEMRLGPSIRRIVDFSDMSRSLSILPTGQSGNPLSAHYGDQTTSWLNGSYKYIYQDSSFFKNTTYETMTLKPQNN